MPATTTPIAVLWRETVQRVDALPAFDRKRGHRVPDEVSNGATAFVRRLAAGDVAREIEDCFQALRAHLMAADHVHHIAQSRELIKPDLVWNIEKGLTLDGAALAAIISRRCAWR